jgi:hypothetical protein
MKTIDNGTTEKHHVVIGAEHPVAGWLYHEVVPDSTVGLVDIYQITDTLCGAKVFGAGWREPRFQVPLSHGHYAETSIAMHLSRIRWYDNEEIRRVCRVHGVPIRELMQWSQDISRWKDIPVVARLDSRRDNYEAVSLLTV